MLFTIIIFIADSLDPNFSLTRAFKCSNLHEFNKKREKFYLNLIFFITIINLQHFETETDDLMGIEWSPDGRVVAVWESPIKVSLETIKNKYKFVIKH